MCRKGKWNNMVFTCLATGLRGVQKPACLALAKEMHGDHWLCSLLDCAGCGRDIKNGQALLALDKQWHLGCFKCKSCGKVLTGEYISK